MKLEITRKGARRVGRVVRRHAAGGKGSAISALVGAVAALGSNQLYKSSKFARETWWVTPALLGVGGHYLKQKKPGKGYGEALLGVAGYQLAIGMQAAKQQEQAAASSSAPPAEAGMMTGRDVGMLLAADEYAAGTAGNPEINRSDRPTSSFYVPRGTVGAPDSAVVEAMGL